MNSTDKTQPRPWVTGQLANGRRFVPDVPVIDQQGEKKMFYSDLVKDKSLLVQFTSVNHHADYPVTRNLANVQRLLGETCGNEIFIYTVNSEPETTTPDQFAAFSKKFSPGPGWSFLSGEPSAIEAIKRTFFVAQSGSLHGKGHVHDCSMGLMRYGNDTAGLWGSVPTCLDPQQIVERMQWIRPLPPLKNKLTRKGPVTPLHNEVRSQP